MSVNICINNMKVSVPEGSTILEAAESAGIMIPTLCHLKKINEISACRVCVVKVKDMPGFKPACSTLVSEGMEIITDSEEVRSARRKNLELICCDHSMSCTECPKGADCRLRDLCREYEVDDTAFGSGSRFPMKDESKPHLVRDNEKCILCRRCESTCRAAQTVQAIFVNYRASETNIGFGLPLSETNCVSCGQCIAACPTGALSVKDDTKAVWKAVFDKETYVVAALSATAAEKAGELLAGRPDPASAGKAVRLLHEIGIDLVIDPNSYAAEFGRGMRTAVEKQAADKKFPILQCTCYAAREFVRRFYPQYTGNILPVTHRRNALAARCKAELKTDKKTFFVSIDGCTSAKTELTSPDSDCTPDAAITARELFDMIRRACVSGFTASEVWKALEPQPYDSLPFLGEARVMGEKPEFLESVSQIGDLELKTVEASGLGNVRRALEQIDNYDILKLDACPGGCKNGGGMPDIGNCQHQSSEI